jgi:O-antigen/teichoic acid export membrane protein
MAWPRIDNLKLTQLSSLQLFQLMRYGTLFLNSVLMSNFLRSVNDVSAYETLFQYGSMFYTFWLSGVTNSLFPLRPVHGKKIYYNAFMVLCVLSTVAGLMMMGFAQTDSSLPNQQLLQEYGIYTIINATTYLTEFLLILEHRYLHVIIYASVIFVLQILCNILPVIFNKDLFVVVHALIFLSVAKLVYAVFILRKFAEAVFDRSIVVNLVRKSSPVMLSLLFAGSIDFSNGYIIRHYLKALDFARYRAGAREFPVFLIMTNTLSNVLSGQIAQFHSTYRLTEGLQLLKEKSLKLMHYLFPAAIVLMCLSKYMFVVLYFNKPEFVEGYKIFNIMLLLVVSRFVFGQTVLMGIHKNRYLAYTSIAEYLAIVLLAWLFVTPFGIVGVAFGMLLGCYLEKVVLVYFCKREGIEMAEYIPIRSWAIYSAVLWVIFIITFFV